MRPYTFLILINFHWSLFHTCRLRLKKKRRSVMAQSIPSVPIPPPPGICHFVLEKLQLCHHGGAWRSYKYPRWGFKNSIFLSEILKKPLLEELTHSPGRGFQTNSLPLGPTRWQMPNKCPGGNGHAWNWLNWYYMNKLRRLLWLICYITTLWI